MRQVNDRFETWITRMGIIWAIRNQPKIDEREVSEANLPLVLNSNQRTAKLSSRPASSLKERTPGKLTDKKTDPQMSMGQYFQLFYQQSIYYLAEAQPFYEHLLWCIFAQLPQLALILLYNSCLVLFNHNNNNAITSIMQQHESRISSFVHLSACLFVQSVISIHQLFCCFWTKVVNIPILELKPVSNERSGHFTFNNNIHDF